MRNPNPTKSIIWISTATERAQWTKLTSWPRSMTEITTKTAAMKKNRIKQLVYLGIVDQVHWVWHCQMFLVGQIPGHIRPEKQSLKRLWSGTRPGGRETSFESHVGPSYWNRWLKLSQKNENNGFHLVWAIKDSSCFETKASLQSLKTGKNMFKHSFMKNRGHDFFRVNHLENNLFRLDYMSFFQCNTDSQ